MTAFRRLFHAHRAIAGLVIALALAMKLLVPAGFMPTMADGRIVVTLCAGATSTTMVMTIPGMAQSDDDAARADAMADTPCAFAGLAMPSLAGADAVLLAIALAVVMALGLQAVGPLPVPTPSHIRPPLRAPPATI